MFSSSSASSSSLLPTQTRPYPAPGHLYLLQEISRRLRCRGRKGRGMTSRWLAGPPPHAPTTAPLVCNPLQPLHLRAGALYDTKWPLTLAHSWLTKGPRASGRGAQGPEALTPENPCTSNATLCSGLSAGGRRQTGGNRTNAGNHPTSPRKVLR